MKTATVAACAFAAVIALLIVIIAFAALSRPARARLRESFGGGRLARAGPAALAEVRGALECINRLAAAGLPAAGLSSESDLEAVGRAKAMPAVRAATAVVAASRRIESVVQGRAPSRGELRGLVDGLRASRGLYLAAAAGLTAAGIDLQKLAAADGSAAADQDALAAAGAHLGQLGACVYRLEAALERLRQEVA